MILGQQIELSPTLKQAQALARAHDAVR